MTHHEFNELKHAATALPPEQMHQLRDELDRKLATLAAVPTAAASADSGEELPDPILGLWQDYADEIDEIVTDAYRKRRESKWREFDL